MEILYFIAKWGLILLALYLCYRCNTNEMIILRILYMILAYLFYPFYLVYYLIFHGLLKYPCSNTLLDVAGVSLK